MPTGCSAARSKPGSATIPEPPRNGRAAPAPLWKRLAWFAALYAAGIICVGLVAYGLRLWIKP